MSQDLKKQLKDKTGFPTLMETYIKTSENPVEAINEIKELLHELSPMKTQPVDLVKWVDINKVKANDYNPNNVAPIEMGLLYTSIHHDGYTQPIVTVYDKAKDEYVIVDGFHRYFIAKNNPTITKRTKGLLPVVVLSKGLNDRMASTIRHNRARGKHTVTGMSSMIFQMLDNGWEDKNICNELGMEAEELLRLKHITGFSKLFKDSVYKRAWVKKTQIKHAKKWGVKA